MIVFDNAFCIRGPLTDEQIRSIKEIIALVPADALKAAQVGHAQMMRRASHGRGHEEEVEAEVARLMALAPQREM